MLLLYYLTAGEFFSLSLWCLFYLRDVA